MNNIVPLAEIEAFIEDWTVDAHRKVMWALADNGDVMSLAALHDEQFEGQTQSHVMVSVKAVRDRLMDEGAPYRIVRITGYRLVRK